MDMVDYPPITPEQVDGRLKKTAPVFVPDAIALATLVSAAVSGLIRHVVGVIVDNVSSACNVELVVADASGATGVVDVIYFGDRQLSGTDGKHSKPWAPEEPKHYYDLVGGEKLLVWTPVQAHLGAPGTASGMARAQATFWDE